MISLRTTYMYVHHKHLIFVAAGMDYHHRRNKFHSWKKIQMMHKYLGKKEHFDYGSIVLEYQHILIMCLKILEMGMTLSLLCFFF